MLNSPVCSEFSLRAKNEQLSTKTHEHHEESDFGGRSCDFVVTGPRQLFSK